jgi:hypothetical protein
VITAKLNDNNQHHLGVENTWGLLNSAKKGGIVQAEEYTFFFVDKEMQIIKQFFIFIYLYIFPPQRIVSAVKRVEWVSDRMSYIVLRGCWSDIALNVHTPTLVKSDDLKYTVDEELE